MMHPHASTSSIFKRAADIVFAITGLVFLLPALAVVALIIKLDSDGPVLKRQQRAGLNGKRFQLYTFRTLETSPAGGDGCLTPFGRILRRTGLDEVPHLINILRGEMSFVGPRSHALAHDETFSALVPNYGERFKASPGLTCLAQIRGLRGEIASREDLEKRLACDLEYIRTWSIGLDIATLVRTVPTLFMRESKSRFK